MRKINAHVKKVGFVYIWKDKKRKRYYIGSHLGSEKDGYICGSTWMFNTFSKRPFDFKRRILKRIKTGKKDLLEEEQKWLNLIKDDELGRKYYNLKRNAIGFKDYENHSEKTKEKQKQAALKQWAEGRGILPPNFKKIKDLKLEKLKKEMV